MNAPRPSVSCRCVWLVAAAVLASWPTTPAAQTLAFPEAEGFGRFATGARTNLASASVYRVTNLNDSGAGSFRDAVSQSNRFVVFDVGGIVTLNSVAVVSSNVTIAGQTAPGGIAFYGDRVAFTGANNTISRYIAVRKGEAGTREDTVNLSRGSNIIFDHMSVTWGVDETFSMNPATGEVIDNITIQNSVIAQGLDRLGHSAGGLMTLGEGSRFSIIKSLFADSVTRNPKVRGENEFINNVVYGYETAGYIMGDTVNMNSRANAIGNYFIEGPVDGSSPFASGTPQFQIYGADNWVDGDRDGLLDGSRITTYPGATVATTPFAFPTTATMTAQQAVAHVTANAGPTITRDAVDTRIMQGVLSYGTLGGVIQYDTDLFPGYATDPVYLNRRSRPVDTDNDGMPDTWERSRGLNPVSGTDWRTLTTGSYTNLETYLNELGGNETASAWTAASGTWSTGTWSGIRPNLTTVASVSGSVAVASGQALARRLTVGDTAAGTVNVSGSLDVFDSLRIGGLAAGTVSVVPGAILGAGEVVLGGTGATAGDGFLTVTGGTLQASFLRAATPGSQLSLSNATIVCTAPPLIAVPTITASNVTIVTPAGTGTWSGSISGSGSLIKQGPGTLVLTASSASTGNLRVDSGTVALNHVAAAGTGMLLLGGGNASFGSVSGIATRIGMIATSGTITAGGITLKGSISGSAAAQLSIATTTTGNLTLSGSLSGFGGTLDFGPSSGNIRLNGFGAAGGTSTTFALGASTAAIRTAFGATVQLGALTGGTGTRLQGATNNADAVTYVVGAKGLSTSFDGTITDGVFTTPGVVSLTKTGTGTLTLSNAASTYTGVTRISGDTLAVAALANGGSASSIGQSTAAAANLVLDGGTLRYAGPAVTIDRGFTLTELGGRLDARGTGAVVFGGTAGIAMAGSGSRTLWLGGTATSFNGLAAAIGDPAAGVTSLVKEGAGTWRLLGEPKTYSGSTTINGGTLMLVTAGVLPTGPGRQNVTMAAGATLDLYGSSHTINGLDGAGTVTTTINTTRTLTIGNADASGTFAGVLTQGTGQSLAVTKIGTGAQRLSLRSTYSGGTTLRGGTLAAGTSGALGTGVVTVTGSARRLAVLATSTLENAIIVDGGAGTTLLGLIQHEGSGRGVLAGGTISIVAHPSAGGIFGSNAGGDLLVTSPIVSVGGARVSVSSGTVTLAGGGSYARLDHDHGTLRVGATHGLATNAVVTLGNSGAATLDLAGFDQSVAGIAKGASAAVIGTSSTVRDATLTVTGSSAYGGILQDSVLGGTRRLNLAVSGGRLRLAAANAHSGTTSVANGTLWLDHGGSLGSSRLRLLAGGTAVVGQTASVAVTAVDFAGGVLDLADGRIDIAAGGLDQDTLVAQLLAGRGDGSWNGSTGVVSASVAAAVASGRPRSIGWLANGDGSLSVAMTAPGDANLDGVVDILDASQFVAGGAYDAGLAAGWSEGDFTYDGVVDLLDTAEFIGAGLFDQGPFGPAPAVASVPEPALPAAGVLAVVLLTITAVRSSACRVPPAKSTTAR
jgi:autotransporter-associated beta strand protein